MNHQILTTKQVECDALTEAYEAAWDIEKKIDDCHLNEEKHRRIMNHILQIAGIIAGEMEVNRCNIIKG